MMCKRLGPVFFLLFWASAFCLAAVSAQDILPDNLSYPPPPPNTKPLSSSATINWDDLEAASLQLWLQAQESQNQAEKLQSLLADSMTRYDKLEQLSKEADQAAQAEIQLEQLHSALWRGAALVSGGLAVGALADGWQGALWGAGTGLVSDGAYEIGHRLFHLW